MLVACADFTSTVAPETATPASDPIVQLSPTEPVEAGLDAGADSFLDAAPNECSDGLTHDFCESFEHVTDYAEHFGGGPELVGTGALRLVRDNAPPNVALLARIGRDDAGTMASAARISEQAPSATRPDGTEPPLDLVFRVLVRQADGPDRAVGITNVLTGSTAAREDGFALTLVESDAGQLALGIDEYTADVDGGSPASHSYATALRIPIATWTDVHVRVNERPKGVTGTGFVVTVGGLSHSQVLTTPNRPSHVRVDVGAAAFYAGGATAVLELDDLMLDYR